MACQAQPHGPRNPEAHALSPAAFYCVADDRYFPGVVALVNSLRLLGHSEPVHVLDRGLTERQRRRLSGEASLVEGSAAPAPWLAKTIAPRLHPAETMILIDADMIATRPLDELIERAAGGSVVVFENDRDRFVPEWGELLELGPIRRRRYVSSGLVLLGGEAGAEVLELLHDRQRHVDIEAGYFGRNVPGYPFIFPEQDVLNAILCTRVGPDRVLTLAHRLTATPPFRGLGLEDPRSLRCAYADGTSPYVLHHYARKPWLTPMRSSVYSRLLTRLVLGEDVRVRLSPDELPLRLRRGAPARLTRFAVDYAVGGPAYLRRRWRERSHDEAWAARD